MKRRTLLGIAVLLSMAWSSTANGVQPTPREMSEARRWAAAKFEGVSTLGESGQDASVRVVANNGPVQPNGRGGGSLHLGNREYTRGLYCHAVSKIVVRLPSPGKTFLALAGIDTNEQTTPGKGSVVFSVRIGEKSLFQSPVMREAMPAVPVQVDLGGAKEFVLEIGDGGDGIGSDQSDWAEARVVLADGKTVWLADLPILAAQPRTCSVEPFFSFTYAGKPSPELLKTWPAKRGVRQLDAQRTEHTLTYTDPKTKLQIQCVGIVYADFPAVEWILYFANKGDKDTPILENVRAIDTAFKSDRTGQFVIHHAGGAKVTITDFAPVDSALAADASLKIGSATMSSSTSLPFFNVDLAGEGVIVGVGWSGGWSAEFARTAAESQTVAVKAGMDSTHLVLHPGERIRTPRMLALFWQNDRLRGHNLWRRLLLAHYSPQSNGKPIVGPLADANWGAERAANHIGKINWWGDHKLPVECYWIDAGWSGKTGEEWINSSATRVPNAEFFPHGMKEVSDAAHQRGLKFLLWTWNTRATPKVEVGAEHPEWLIANFALDNGNPTVNRWMIDKYSKMIEDFGMDIYRQDGGPAYSPDAEPNRQGINQIRNTEGFYAFWDALLQRHPGLVIDNCAGGGNRLDIETIARSISLWRSDYQCPDGFDPIGMQGQTYGLSLYVPLSGGCVRRVDPYGFRSGYSPALCLGWHGYSAKIDDTGFDFDAARKLLEDYLALRPYFYGDYYPLTSYSVAKDVWMAWQFDRPEQGDGMVQAFRRPESIYESARAKLHGLEPDAIYTIANRDVPGTSEMRGHELMERGLPLTIAEQPGSVVITYKKKS